MEINIRENRKDNQEWTIHRYVGNNGHNSHNKNKQNQNHNCYREN
jgi:hypothetical protein